MIETLPWKTPTVAYQEIHRSGNYYGVMIAQHCLFGSSKRSWSEAFFYFGDLYAGEYVN